MYNTRKTRIMSVGSFLPSQIVKSDDLLSEINSEVQYNIPLDWMSKTMGIIERRMAPADANPSDLAIPAAREAIINSKIAVSEIDMVIFCGIERDNPEPATAHIIQNALGINARYCFDVANACFGFFDAMSIADGFIKTKNIQKALVVTGEVPTRLLRFFADKLKKGVDIKTARKIIGSLTVGDAGGAVILEASDDDSGFDLFNVVSDSKHFNKCIYNHKTDGSMEGQMLMGPISNAILSAHEDLIDDTLMKLHWKKFDWMLSHQMGLKPFNRISALNGVNPRKMIKTFPKLGNITSATFPVNFQKLTVNGKVKSGDKVGGCFAGSGLAVGQLGYIF